MAPPRQRSREVVLLLYLAALGEGVDMSRRKEDSVMVFLDGAPLFVPRKVDCHYAARGALGLGRGDAVCLQHRAGETDDDRLYRKTDPLSFAGSWEFQAGDHYVKVDPRDVSMKKLEELSREPWEQDAEGWKPADSWLPDTSDDEFGR